MRRIRHLAWPLAMLLAALAAAPLPAGRAGGPEILFPAGRNQLVSSADHLLILDPGGADWESLELTRVVQRRAVRAVNLMTHRKDLAQLVRGLFSESFRVSRIDIELAAGAPGIKPLSLSETIKDEQGLDLQEFWASQAFARIYTAAARDSLASRVSVTLTGREVTRQRRGAGGEGHCAATLLRLRLDPGLNEVLLRSLDARGKLIEETALSYLYRPGGELDSAAGVEAGLHEASRFHTGNWEACAPCHKLDPSTEELADPRGATRSCLPCHQRLLEHRVTHKPVQSLTCMGCHALPASEDGVTVKAACTGCHTAFRQAAAASPTVHPLTREGRCTVCHDPHGSGLDGRLREEIHLLCTNCHQKRYEEGHPVLQHPVRSVDDPLAPGHELTCVSCHDPHASPDPALLKVVDGRVRRCAECHPK